MKSARSLVLIAERSGIELSALTRITRLPFGRTSSALTLEFRPEALPSKSNRHEHEVVPSPYEVASQTTMSSSLTTTLPSVALLPSEIAIDGSWAAATDVQTRHASVAAMPIPVRGESSLENRGPWASPFFREIETGLRARFVRWRRTPCQFESRGWRIAASNWHGDRCGPVGLRRNVLGRAA